MTYASGCGSPPADRQDKFVQQHDASGCGFSCNLIDIDIKMHSRTVMLIYHHRVFHQILILPIAKNHQTLVSPIFTVLIYGSSTLIYYKWISLLRQTVQR